MFYAAKKEKKACCVLLQEVAILTLHKYVQEKSFVNTIEQARAMLLFLLNKIYCFMV